jgi:hypothetical protein
MLSAISNASGQLDDQWAGISSAIGETVVPAQGTQQGTGDISMAHYPTEGCQPPADVSDDIYMCDISLLIY